jgi:type IV pilus assembly protein PilC
MKIQKKSKPLFYFDKKIKPLDIILLMRNLSTMSYAGIPLLTALNSLEQGQDKPRMRKLLSSIKTDISQGQLMADSLSKHPRYFEILICNLLRTAEMSGTLDTTLKHIAEHLEKSAALKKKIHKALTYPTLVLALACIVATILLVLVVPQFQSLFKSFGAQLPLPTRIIIHCSTSLQQYWWLFIMLAGFGVTAVKTANTYSRSFSCFVDRYKLKFIIIGPLVEKAILARITRSLATTLAAGVPLVNALTSVAEIANNSVYQQAMLGIRDHITKGESLQDAMNNCGQFPPMVTQMIAVGEASATLETVLNKIASYYEEDVDNIVSNLSNLIEPIIMMILGIIVGGFVLAMYLPIFKLGSVFTS